MMWYDGHGWNGGWWIVGPLVMLAFWGLVAWVVITLVRRPPAAPPGASGPEQVLAERFARGEIDEDEYRRRLRVLREG